jgi:hypothetical protein
MGRIPPTIGVPGWNASMNFFHDFSAEVTSPSNLMNFTPWPPPYVCTVRHLQSLKYSRNRIRTHRIKAQTGNGYIIFVPRTFVLCFVHVVKQNIFCTFFQTPIFSLILRRNRLSAHVQMSIKISLYDSTNSCNLSKY